MLKKRQTGINQGERELRFNKIWTCTFLLLLVVWLCGCVSTDSWTAAQWQEQGNKFAKDHLYKEAIDAYNQSIAKDRNNPKTWVYRGVALQQLGFDQQAMQNFDSALEMDSNLSSAWQGKAAVYINQSQYNLALKSADRAIILAGNDDKPENAWYLKGYAQNRLEEYDDALLSFDKAIELDPKRVDFWNNKAYSLTKLGRYMEVLKCYEVMTTIQPNDPELWNKKGEIYMALGQINEANNAFSMAKGLIKNS